MQTTTIIFDGLPVAIAVEGVPPDAQYEVALTSFHTRIGNAVKKLLTQTGRSELNVQATTAIGQVTQPNEKVKDRNPDELTTEQRAEQYASVQPSYQLKQLIVPPDVLTEIHEAVDAIRVEGIVYDDWGLRKIEPFPRSALNFHGAPGTGKTLAAHGVAASLDRNILVASYAQIESKFHGDGPKNVEALFFAAQRDNAVLFLDEADSLLSRRLTNVTQGSEQAINSMRSQLLICLEKFHGVVIFATNLVENYDDAFETRVRHIHFPMPDVTAREAIWRKHLPSEMPLADDVNVSILAQAESEFCGRDIKNAVVSAATKAAIAGKEYVTQADLLSSVNIIVEARKALRKKQWQATPLEEEPVLATKIADAVSQLPSA